MVCMALQLLIDFFERRLKFFVVLGESGNAGVGIGLLLFSVALVGSEVLLGVR